MKQYLTNKGSVRVASHELASALFLSKTMQGPLAGQTSNTLHKIPMSERESLDHTVILLQSNLAERSIGLRELAPLIGLDLGDIAETTSTGVSAQRELSTRRDTQEAGRNRVVEIRLDRSVETGMYSSSLQ